MISKEKLQAEPLFVSLQGQSKDDQSWIIFDHYQYEKEKLFLIGLNLEDEEKRIPFEQITFSEENIEYAVKFVETQLHGIQSALNALKKIKHTKGQLK